MPGYLPPIPLKRHFAKKGGMRKPPIILYHLPPKQALEQMMLEFSRPGDNAPLAYVELTEKAAAKPEVVKAEEVKAEAKPAEAPKAEEAKAEEAPKA